MLLDTLEFSFVREKIKTKALTVHLLNPQTDQTYKTPKKRAYNIAHTSLLGYIHSIHHKGGDMN